MKRKMGLLCLAELFSITFLSGCTNYNTQIRNENRAAINLTLEQSEEQKAGEKMDFSRGDLRTMFEEVNDESIIQFFYSDYNKDGSHEAFVLTKADGYKLWYMSPDGCEIVNPELASLDGNGYNTLSYTMKEYLLLHQNVDGQKRTLVYSIDNADKVTESNLSGKGFLYQDETGALLIDSYDSKARSAFCTYYLYYALDEGFREYGAIPISEDQFLEFEGAKEILEKIHEQYKNYAVEYSFLYRSNNYIHINIALKKTDKWENYHMTVSYDNHKVEIITNELMPGTIQTAFMLEIATFPVVFRHPDGVVGE